MEEYVEIILKNNSLIKLRTNKITENPIKNRLEMFDLDSRSMFYIKIDEIIYYSIKLKEEI